jgi:hypothetical protein
LGEEIMNCVKCGTYRIKEPKASVNSFYCQKCGTVNIPVAVTKPQEGVFVVGKSIDKVLGRQYSKLKVAGYLNGSNGKYFSVADVKKVLEEILVPRGKYFTFKEYKILESVFLACSERNDCSKCRKREQCESIYYRLESVFVTEELMEKWYSKFHYINFFKKKKD